MWSLFRDLFMLFRIVNEKWTRDYAKIKRAGRKKQIYFTNTIFVCAIFFFWNDILKWCYILLENCIFIHLLIRKKSNTLLTRAFTYKKIRIWVIESESIVILAIIFTKMAILIRNKIKHKMPNNYIFCWAFG